MSKLPITLLPIVVNAINEYGIEVTVYRNVYENIVGVKTLVEEKKEVATLKMLIDNSTVSMSSNKYKTDGMLRPQTTATIYYAYDENINLEYDDYVIVDGLRYILTMPQNVLHYDVLYQVNAEVVIDEYND